MGMGVTARVGRPSWATMTLPPPVFSGVLNRQEKDAP